MKVVFTEDAGRDLLDIGDYIAADSPLRALSFVREVRRKARDIGSQPRSFPVVPRYESKGIRRRRFRAYLIFYRVDPQAVVILHILHGARDYEVLLDKLP